MAKKMGVAPSTLRYYDKEGLLPFVERSGGGIRMFKDEDIEWLSIIECLKKTGMSIKEIKQFIDWCIEGDSTINKRLELIDRRRERVHEQIRDEDIPEDIREIKRKLHERMNGEKNKNFAVFHGKALKCAILCVTIADINDGTMESRSAETGGSFSFSPPK